MRRPIGRLWFLAVAGLLLASCGGASSGPTPDDTLSVSGLTGRSPILSPLATPSAEVAEVLPSVELVVLHTNDNWGETEPCG